MDNPGRYTFESPHIEYTTNKGIVSTKVAFILLFLTVKEVLLYHLSCLSPNSAAYRIPTYIQLYWHLHLSLDPKNATYRGLCSPHALSSGGTPLSLHPSLHITPRDMTI
jgi:hypothetical protein